MRRLELVVAFVVALVVVAVASGPAVAAASPEWAECVKVKGGPYEKGCGSQGGKGGYELSPGVTGSGFFEAKAKGLDLDVTEPGLGTGEISCKGAVEEGQRVMPNLLTHVRVTLQECTAPGSRCYHEEEEPFKAKYIELEALEGELGYVSRSPLKVGLQLWNAADPGGSVVPQIECGTVYHQRWSGRFDGELVLSKEKPVFRYVLGAYEGEVAPGYTPLTNSPFEGEEAGLFRAEVKHARSERWGPEGGLPGGVVASFQAKAGFAVKG